MHMDAVNEALPQTVLELSAISPSLSHRGVGLAVINFNTARQTLRCLASLRESTVPWDWVVVLDNASRDEDYQALIDGCSALPESQLTIYRSAVNLGFAAGSNFLIKCLLSHSDCHYVNFLNNDAVAQPGMLQALLSTLQETNGRGGMAGGRMHRLAAPEEVDTLGISLYASLMPADRKDTGDTYLGPTGGCCLMSRELLADLQQVSGYWFDERYFCYCEDTDLVLRTVLLNYCPAYTDELLALHEGQASSKSIYSDFITYHGIRNSIWMHVKLMPNNILLKYGILLLFAHVLTLARHTFMGNSRLIIKVYRDAFNRFPEFWLERKIFSQNIRLNSKSLDALITPNFYRNGYFSLVARQIKNRLKIRPS